MIVYICTAGKLIDCIDIEVIILKQPLKSRGNINPAIKYENIFLKYVTIAA